MIGRDRHVTSGGTKIGMHSLGASATINDLPTRFRLTSEKMLSSAMEQIGKPGRQMA
jgi:transketolase